MSVSSSTQSSTQPSTRPSTIEAVLRGHPKVADVAVLVPPDRADARVVAVVTEGWCSPVDLRDYLWQSVPDGETPDALVVVPDLPRDADGAPDPDRLGRLRLDGPGVATFRRPATGTEVAVAAVWSEVLGRALVGADDSFLDLGGDSMTGVLLLDQISARLGVPLSFDELLAAPSLSALAERIDGDR